jgi:hypothetical protein
MITPDRKVRKLMEEFQKTGKLCKAALRADMAPKTARKYLKAGRMPSQMKVEHTWRTRPDPFAEYWSEAEEMITDAPELEAKTLFEWLCECHPEAYQEGQLRTFQRRVREWRALSGPAREVYFPQEHYPGKKMETDFTWMNSLGITIRGEPFAHKFCHSVLTYSNWEWGAVCHSESLLALKKGLQGTLSRLGRIPEEHWTDHSTAATHAIEGDKDGDEDEKKHFNRKYLEMVDHFGIKPKTIQVRAPNENGDVESSNGAFKRRVEQHLLLRGSRDFDSVKDYVAFIEGVMEKANRLRRKRLSEELAVMRVLDARLLPEYTTKEVRVTSWSTVQVARNTYSVPSRLRGEKVKARVYEDHIELYYHGVHQLSMPRLLGERKHSINYRHIIDSLLRKPGAFRNYKYRQDLFPAEEFRWTYDQLCEVCVERVADLEYLRILKQAAQTMECLVRQVLGQLRAGGIVPRWDMVEKLAPVPRPELPELTPLKVDLSEYDYLLQRKEVAV